MALLLGIETSTHSFSCSLHADGKAIAHEQSIADQTTASMLAVMIEKLFAETKIKKDQLSAVTVASGPGSYTGLRIGVATAKGICFALGIPLIAINTLHLMAYQLRQTLAPNEDSLLCPMLDARRMEVYCTLFDQELNVVQPTEAKVIDEKSFSDQLDQRSIYFFGEGSDKCKEIIGHPNAKFILGIKPTASVLGELGNQKFLTADFEDLEHFEPFYLKDFIIKKPNSVS